MTRWKPIEHPLCSPDLVPSDFHLLPHLKKTPAGNNYESSTALISVVTRHLRHRPESWFADGNRVLPDLWNNVLMKCCGVLWRKGNKQNCPFSRISYNRCLRTNTLVPLTLQRLNIVYFCTCSFQ